MSGTVVAVYSRVLEPNQDVLITEDVTVQITNITLEVSDDEKTASAAGRSILKMQHLEAHPALLQAAAGYPDFDSDSDDDMFDDSEEDDEEDEDEEEEAADMSKISKASASSAGKKSAAVNGKAVAEEEDEEDDEDFAEEDDSDDEDDEEDGFERQEAEIQIASLIPGKVEHLNTNVILPGGEDFVFHLSGKYKVHLFGHYIVQPTPPQLAESDYSGSDYDSDDEELDSDDLADSELEDDDEDASDRFMEIEESPKKSSKTELPATAAATKPTSTDDKSKLSKNQLKKLAKKEKDAVPAAAAAPATEAVKPASKADSKKEKADAKPASADAAAATAAKKAPSKKQTLPSGLVFEDNKVGSGPVAKSGQRVSMRYIGRLNNGKIFDQNTKGAPFSFKLGKGEVIKGWDQGIAGMQVGGERRLVIPANLAYGKQGVAGIPPNSTLTFEVKLLSIK